VPLAGYFIFVGGTLTALLFAADWYLPTPPPVFAVHQHDIDRTIIRIRSARKWPEKVVLDTSHPTITSPAVEKAAAEQSVRPASDEAGNQSKLESMAQLKPDAEPPAFDRPALQVKRGAATNARSKRHIAHRLARAEPDGGCCLFGRIDNRQAFSNAMPQRGVALSRPMDWQALIRRN
jgi:hypothetical protein